MFRIEKDFCATNDYLILQPINGYDEIWEKIYQVFIDCYDEDNYVVDGLLDVNMIKNMHIYL